MYSSDMSENEDVVANERETEKALYLNRIANQQGGQWPSKKKRVVKTK